VKAQLESLIARAPAPAAAAPEPVRPAAADPRPVAAPALPADEERARRMAALADRIQGLAAPARPGGRDNVAAIVGALTANQTAKQNLNRARRTLDEDLFAA
jgi:hypothetical protein